MDFLRKQNPKCDSTTYIRERRVIQSWPALSNVTFPFAEKKKCFQPICAEAG